MKEYTFPELGYFTESQCKAIREALQGKTYMRFNIHWGGVAGNNTLIVSTDYDAAENEVKYTFIALALAELARLVRNR